MSLSRRHATSIDVAGCLHTIETDPHADVACCCRPLSSFVNWTGDVALPHRCCWGAQWVVAVVERLREVVGIGGGGDEAEVVDDGGREGKSLFVYDVYVNFWQTPLMRLSKRQRGCLVIILANLTNLTKRRPLCLYIYKTSFRPAPTAQTSQARPCLRCRSQLARGTPPRPPGTHA